MFYSILYHAKIEMTKIFFLSYVLRFSDFRKQNSIKSQKKSFNFQIQIEIYSSKHSSFFEITVKTMLYIAAEFLLKVLSKLIKNFYFETIIITQILKM